MRFWNTVGLHTTQALLLLEAGSRGCGGPLPHLSTPQLHGKKARCSSPGHPFISWVPAWPQETEQQGGTTSLMVRGVEGGMTGLMARGVKGGMTGLMARGVEWIRSSSLLCSKFPTCCSPDSFPCPGSSSPGLSHLSHIPSRTGPISKSSVVGAMS